MNIAHRYPARHVDRTRAYYLRVLHESGYPDVARMIHGANLLARMRAYWIERDRNPTPRRTAP